MSLNIIEYWKIYVGMKGRPQDQSFARSFGKTKNFVKISHETEIQITGRIPSTFWQ